MKKYLKKYFGYDNFRTGQEDIVNNIYNGRDVLAIMPTGAGKSICYQLPALMSEGITIVISPLVSLMSDQVRSLIQLGIRGAYLNSTLTYKQYLKALQNAKSGMYKIIYVAPERLETKEFIDFAVNSNISIISIDEAHCVSQWGQDFRPSYLRIKQFVDLLPKRPTICAFTATATNEVKNDILQLLGLNNPYILKTGFDRPNLYFETIEPENKLLELVKILKSHRDDSGIIYCISRKNVEEVYDFLEKRGYNATRYHAGLDIDERKKNQEDFINDRKNIIVATNAFGMGIDKSDVRYVIHYNMPRNMEAYYQEAGRAGRDGEKAECILMYEQKDYFVNKLLINKVEDNEELAEEQIAKIIENEEKKLNQMRYYSTMKSCLRNYMLYYFGENSQSKCDNCSNCLKDKKLISIFNENVDYNLIKLLKQLRKNISKQYGIPSATIFTDGTIREMAIKKPLNKSQMLGIEGINGYKLKRYGSLFINLIKDYEEGNL